MIEGVSRWRIYVLRAFYLFVFVAFGSSIWPSIISPGELWEPVEGVTYSFYAAFSALCFLGFLHPLRMLPLLFIQLGYKSIWLLAVGLQLWQADAIDDVAAEFVRVCAIGVVIDLLVIPWPYVYRTYLNGPYMFKTQSEIRQTGGLGEE